MGHKSNGSNREEELHGLPLCSLINIPSCRIDRLLKRTSRLESGFRGIQTCWKPALKIIYCIVVIAVRYPYRRSEASFEFETPFRCELICVHIVIPKQVS